MFPTFRFLFIPALFALFFMTSGPVSAAPEELMVLGNQFVSTASGCTVVLRGVNIASMEYNSQGTDGGVCGNYLGTLNRAVTQWKSNIVRVPLSQDFWFGVGNVKDPNPSQDNYRAYVDAIVINCMNKGAYCLLDLHWSGRGTWGTGYQQENMPDDHAVDFWTDVATRYANNPAVMFDLYNEPKSVSWEIWRNGGDAGGFHTPGLQNLLLAIRATGATNLIVAGGLDWGYDLSQIPTYALTDTAAGRGVAYSSHIYPWKGNPYWTPAGGTTKIDPAGVLYPVFIGEFGQNANDSGSCGNCQDSGFPGYSTGAWVTSVIQWMEQKGYSGAAWNFMTSASPVLLANCSTFDPTVYNGAPVSQWLSGAVTSTGCPADFTPVITETPTMTHTPTATATGTLPTRTFTITRSPTITRTVTPTPVSTLCTSVFNGMETIGENGMWMGNNGNLTLVDSSSAPPGSITQGSHCMKVDIYTGVGWNNQVLNLTGSFTPKSWGSQYQLIVDVYADPAFILNSGAWHQLFLRVDSGTQLGKSITTPGSYSLNGGANNNLVFALNFGGSDISPTDLLDTIYFIYNSQNAATGTGALYVDNIRLVRGCSFTATGTPTHSGTPTATTTPTPTGTWITDTPTPTVSSSPTATPTPGSEPLGMVLRPSVFPWPDSTVPGWDTLRLELKIGGGVPKDVTLKIFTSSYRKVKRMEFPSQTSGTVLLDPRDEKGQNLSSGLYYLVLEDKTGNRATRKLVIRK